MDLEKRVEALEKEIAELRGQVSERPTETYSDNFVRKLIGVALIKAERLMASNDAPAANQFVELAVKLSSLR